MPASTRTDDPLDAFLADVLTPETAEQLLAFKLPQRLQDRVAALADRSNEGRLTADERREYAKYVGQIDVIAMVKLKARQHLKSAVPVGGAV